MNHVDLNWELKPGRVQLRQKQEAAARRSTCRCLTNKKTHKKPTDAYRGREEIYFEI